MALPSQTFQTTLNEARPVDVTFIGVADQHYPFRLIALSVLNGLRGVNVVYKFPDGARPHPCWWDDAAFDAHQVEYAGWLRQAKILVCDGSVFNYPVQKYFEAMACGCLVVAPLPRDAAVLGFVDGETMVAADPHNLLDKVGYYLTYPTERRRIVENAWRLVQKNYTCEAQVAIFIRKLRQILNGAPVASLNTGFEPWR
jgi:glycosyltransferase involved in cell wall biosynthesis